MLWEGMPNEEFMRIAIKEAKKADFPYGAVIVKKGKVIARAGTAGAKSTDPTAHAEVTAIRKACKKLNSKTLVGCTLYSTCEPCPMCFAAMWWAKIETLVFGMSLKDSNRLSGPEINMSCTVLNRQGGNRIKVLGGLLKRECLGLFK